MGKTAKTEDSSETVKPAAKPVVLADGSTPAIVSPRPTDPVQQGVKLGVGTLENVIDIVLALEGGGAAIAPTNAALESTETSAFKIASNAK